MSARALNCSRGPACVRASPEPRPSEAVEPAPSLLPRSDVLERAWTRVSGSSPRHSSHEPFERGGPAPVTYADVLNARNCAGFGSPDPAFLERARRRGPRSRESEACWNLRGSLLRRRRFRGLLSRCRVADDLAVFEPDERRRRVLDHAQFARTLRERGWRRLGVQLGKQ